MSNNRLKRSKKKPPKNNNHFSVANTSVDSQANNFWYIFYAVWQKLAPVYRKTSMLKQMIFSLMSCVDRLKGERGWFGISVPFVPRVYRTVNSIRVKTNHQQIKLNQIPDDNAKEPIFRLCTRPAQRTNRDGAGVLLPFLLGYFQKQMTSNMEK